jgi:glycosyltransferase involved in cell wall biosynthesis
VTRSGASLSERLAVFAPSMAGGGAERSALKLADGLSARGFEVDLVLATAQGPRMAEVPPTVRVVDLGAPRVLASLPKLASYLRREKPRALASVLVHANIVALWAAKLSRYHGRVVVVEHNTRSVAAAHGKSRRDRFMPRLVRRFYSMADRVVAVSAGVAEDIISLAALDPAKVRVIYNPVVTPELAEYARAPVPHPWFDDDTPVFVAAGRLRPQKDFPTLLRAFATLRARRSARLVILGDGPEQENLQTLATELGIAADVQLPGATANPYAYMARAVAFVLSSRWEGLPTVLVEALRCGVPVIATDCPSGSREILGDGRYGTLVPVGDVRALADAMEVALDGKLRPAPDESWRPHELDVVVGEYVAVLLGEPMDDTVLATPRAAGAV